MTANELADWIHETSRSCKKDVPKAMIDGRQKWVCEDCFYTAKQAMFLIGQEFNKGLVEKITKV